jgi:Na+-driven multidrug efflux pump
MTKSSVSDQRVLAGPILSTFFYYVVPSLIGLVAISTASIVDGIFVGHFVGPDALAAVTLLIPYFTLLFGASLMLAVGGSVRAGRYLGAGETAAASGVFSKTLLAVFLLAVVAAALSNSFDARLYGALGAPESLFSDMRSYLRVISLALVVQLVSLVCYYFVRLDGRPVLATSALVVGAAANIGLNALFLIYFGWGLAGAAWATGLSQFLQLCVLSSHFVSSKSHLRFSFAQRDWSELARSAFNGASEFVNEVSAGIVMLVLNWLMVTRVGVHGVAAFAVVNFAMFASLMIFYGVADALHLLVSQNLGAGNVARIRGFTHSALGCVALLSVLFCAAFTGLGEYWLSFFVDGSSTEVREQALQFMHVVWPLFLVNGANVAFTVYLAAMHRPLPAGLLALARSLLLPTTFLLMLAIWAPGLPFVVALPLAEWTTFLAGVWLFIRFRPESCVNTEVATLPTRVVST